MIIHSAKFVKSSEHAAQCPQDTLPEFALAGRSNVGKSSLINTLTGMAQLSKVSGVPGKTRLINHFIINNEWYLVDLPGYGYAKASKSMRHLLSTMITNYLRQRKSLSLLFLLIDSRLPPQRIDLEMINFLGEEGIPFQIVFTKTDKLSSAAMQKTLQLWQTLLLQSWEELPSMLPTSAAKKTGLDAMLQEIQHSIKLIQNAEK
jgi:GTP-binding protein